MLTGVDLLIVGSPTHGGRPSESMKRFLSNLGPGTLKGVHAAAFDTGMPIQGQKRFLRFIIRFFGYASRHIASALRTKGANVIGADTFFVLGKKGPLKDGEIERAKTWAQHMQRLAGPQKV